MYSLSCSVTLNLSFCFNSEGRINLIGFKPEGVDENRPITMLSIEESNSNARSTSNLNDEGGVTIRSSRSGSRLTNTQGTPMKEGSLLEENIHLSASQTSLDSQKSSASMVLPEVAVAEA